MHLGRHSLSRVVARIEVLVIVAIMVTIAGLVARVVFAAELRAFDDALFRSLGIDPALGRFAAGVLVLLGLLALSVHRAVRRRRQARINKLPFLRIPIDRSAPKT